MSNIVSLLGKLGYSILKNPTKLHYELKMPDKLKLVIWDRPGLWCSDDQIKGIVKDLRFVISKSTDKNIPEYGVLLGEREDMKTRLILIIYQNDESMAFSAQSHIDFRIGLKNIHVIHLGLAYVDKNVRGGGLASMAYVLPNLLLLLKSGFRSHWISNVTQVPSIFGQVEDFYTNVYPNTTKKPQTFEHFLIAGHIMKNHRSVFGVGDDCIYDAHHQIIRNAYTGGSDNLKKTFEECTKSRNPKVNDFMMTRLDYGRGDDVIQLGILDYKLLFKFVGAKGVNSSLMFIAFKIVLLFFSICLVPVSRWLIDEENIWEKNEYKK